MELAQIHIPHNAREHIKALLPYATRSRVIVSSTDGVVGWELDLQIPKNLINPDVDIEFLRRNNICMQIEADETYCDYGFMICPVLREPPYYKINLSYHE